MVAVCLHAKLESDVLGFLCKAILGARAEMIISGEIYTPVRKWEAYVGKMQASEDEKLINLKV